MPPILRENYSDSSLGSDFEDINNPSKRKIENSKNKKVNRTEPGD